MYRCASKKFEEIVNKDADESSGIIYSNVIKQPNKYVVQIRVSVLINETPPVLNRKYSHLKGPYNDP